MRALVRAKPLWALVARRRQNTRKEEEVRCASAVLLLPPIPSDARLLATLPFPGSALDLVSHAGRASHGALDESYGPVRSRRFCPRQRES